MNAAERLRIAAEYLPPGSSITVGREELLEALTPLEASARDLTVPEVGERMGRSASTVRTWLQQGSLRGYRFRGREWRIPLGAVGEFLDLQRRGETRGTAKRETTDLAAWRKEQTA